MEYHRLELFHHTGSQKSKVKVLAGLVPPEGYEQRTCSWPWRALENIGS